MREIAVGSFDPSLLITKRWACMRSPPACKALLKATFDCCLPRRKVGAAQSEAAHVKKLTIADVLGEDAARARDGGLQPPLRVPAQGQPLVLSTCGLCNCLMCEFPGDHWARCGSSAMVCTHECIAAVVPCAAIVREGERHVIATPAPRTELQALPCHVLP